MAPPGLQFSADRHITVPSAVQGNSVLGNAVVAATAVEKSLQTQSRVKLPDSGHDYGDVFDELLDTFHRNQKITPALYKKWLDVDSRIEAEIAALLESD